MANKTVNIDVQVQTKSLQDLENELEQINSELKEVPIGSQAFKELSGQAQQVTKQLEGVNQEIEGFTLDKKIETSQAAVLGLAGGLEATVGTLGLLGIESEVFGAFEEKAISALTAARGFIDLSEGFGKLTKSINLSTLAAQTFGKVSRKALIGTGIGALVVATGAIVANFDKIVDLFNKLRAEAKKLQGEYEILIENSQSQVSVLETQLQSNILLGESTKEITDEIRTQLILQEEYNMKLIESLETQLEQEKNEEKRQEIQAQINTAKEEQAQLELRLLTLNQDRSQAEEDYLALTQELSGKIAEDREQSILQTLQVEREAVRERIEALEIEDTRKRELLDDYEEYFKRKEEELTRKTREEAVKRQRERLEAAASLLIALGEQELQSTARLREIQAEGEEERLAAVQKNYDEEVEYAEAKNQDLINQTTLTYENLITQAKEAGADTKLLEELFDDALTAIDINFKNQNELREIEYQEKIASIKQEYIDADIARQKEQDDADQRRIQSLAENARKRIDTIVQFQNSLLDITSKTLDSISSASDLYFETRSARLERERSEIESNINLTAEQREAALDRVEEKERQLEIDRIKRENRLFNIRQAIALQEELIKVQAYILERKRIAQITAANAQAAGQEIAVEGAKQTGKASMSLGAFTSAAGPLGPILYALSIGGIIASIIAAKRKANAEIKALQAQGVGGGGGGGSIGGGTTSAAPVGNTQPAIPQSFNIEPVMKTYVLTGDVTSGQEAEAKLNTKRTI